MKLLLMLLGGLRKLLGLALGTVQRHPWPFAVAAALALAWWQWSGRQDALAQRAAARTALATEKTGRAADRAAWRHQVATAQAATAAAERKSQEIATNAQSTHAALAADNAGLRGYIADRGLWTRSGPALAARPADDLGAALPAPTAGTALVAADEADLVICDAAYVYAASAHQWAKSLIADGLAQGSAK